VTAAAAEGLAAIDIAFCPVPVAAVAPDQPALTGHSAVSWPKTVLPELTELDGDTLGVGVAVGEVEGVALVEEWALEEAEALPVAVADALPVALTVEVPVLCGVALAVGEAVALGVLVGVAFIASHSLSMIESVDTMVFASVRLVAVIELSTFDCSLVGSPETVTVALA